MVAAKAVYGGVFVESINEDAVFLAVMSRRWSVGRGHDVTGLGQGPLAVVSLDPTS